MQLEQNSLPLVRSGHSGQVFRGRYYLFGGKFQDQRFYSPVECFEIDKLAWRSCPDSLSENRIEHTTNLIDAYLVVFGGYESQRIFNDIKIFDLESNLWLMIQVKNSGPSHRYGHASIIFKESLFIFGGMDKQKPLNDLWRFNFADSTYRSLTPSWNQVAYLGIIPPLFRCSMVDTNGGFLLIAGAKAFQRYSKGVYYFSDEKSSFSRVTPASDSLTARCLCHVRLSHQTFQLNRSTMLIIGGFNGGYLDDCFTLSIPAHLASTQQKSITPVRILQPETQDLDDSRSDASSAIEMDRCSEWTEVRDVNPKFENRTGHTMVSMEGSLYIFGGTNYKVASVEQNMNNELWRYNETEFTQLKPDGDQISPRSSCKSCESPKDKLIYFYGGYSNRKDNCFDDLYCYDVAKNCMKYPLLIEEDRAHRRGSSEAIRPQSGQVQELPLHLRRLRRPGQVQRALQNRPVEQLGSTC